MKGLSVRAPWWWYILHAGKDIENRDWSTRYRGPLLIMASKWWEADEVAATALEVARMMGDKEGAASPSYANLRYGMRSLGGHVVGLVDVVDCVASSDSPWFVGRYGLKLANPRVAPNPVPFPGALTMVDVPDDVLDRLGFARGPA